MNMTMSSYCGYYIVSPSRWETCAISLNAFISCSIMEYSWAGVHRTLCEYRPYLLPDIDFMTVLSSVIVKSMSHTCLLCEYFHAVSVTVKHV
jgi:hypothetical protein